MSRTTERRIQLSTRRRCIFAAITLACVLTGLEAAARWLTPAALSNTRYRQIHDILIYLGNEPGNLIFEPDPERFWKLKPGLNSSTIGDRRWTGFLSNSQGFRNREFDLQRPDHSVRVACFGDSTTFGFGVAQHEAWPQQLEDLLNDRADLRTGGDAEAAHCQVINAGVPGYSSYQGLRYLEAALPELRADLVVLTFGTNDSWYWDGHTDVALANSLAQSGVSFLEKSSFFRLVQNATQRIVGQQPDRAGQEWARKSWRNEVEPDWQPRVSLDEFDDHMRQMLQICRDNDAACIILVWPDRLQLHYRPSHRDPYVDQLRQIAAESRGVQVRLVDVLAECRVRSLDPTRLFLPADPVHFQARGNRLVAELLAAEMAQLKPSVQP